MIVFAALAAGALLSAVLALALLREVRLRRTLEAGPAPASFQLEEISLAP